jgi:hypothetical protein
MQGQPHIPWTACPCIWRLQARNRGRKCVDGLKISDDDLKGKCKDCMMGHQTRHPFNGKTEKNLEPLDLVLFNPWGPSHTQSTRGKAYLMIIVDAGTSHKHGAYLADKSDSSTLEAFDIFCSQAETTTGRKIC